MPDSVVRWQILSPEPEKSVASYAKLFSWQSSNANQLGYRELSTGSAGAMDGGVWPAPPAERAFVQLFIAVDDIDACIRKAEKLGGTVLVPKSVLPDGDIMAVLQDPTGLSFGVCHLRDGS